jgi:hypothetical protein
MKLPIRQFYHFGCPVYVLDSNLQANKRGGSKWRQRTRLGINLGFSPQHAKSVHLVLSLQSGCVSPQFHCTFDNNFETLKEYNLPESLWQQKAHFIAQCDAAKAQREEQRNEADTNHPHPESNNIPPMLQEGDPRQEVEPPIQQAKNEGSEEQATNAEERNQAHEVETL